MIKMTLTEAMKKADEWRDRSPAANDFARAVCAYFALPMDQVNREMSMSADAFGDLTLTVSIRTKPDDLVGIANEMKAEQEAAGRRQLDAFLGKPVIPQAKSERGA